MFQGEKAASFSIRVEEPFIFCLILKNPVGWDWLTSYEVVQERMTWCTLRLESERLTGAKLEGEGKEGRVVLYSVNGIDEVEVAEEAEKRYGKWKWEAFAYVLNALHLVEFLL